MVECPVRSNILNSTQPYFTSGYNHRGLVFSAISLTLPSILLTLVLSPDLVFAEEGVTNQNGYETRSVPPQISQAENISPEEVRRIRQELLIEPLVKTKPREVQKPTVS